MSGPIEHQIDHPMAPAQRPGSAVSREQPASTGLLRVEIPKHLPIWMDNLPGQIRDALKEGVQPAELMGTLCTLATDYITTLVQVAADEMADNRARSRRGPSVSRAECLRRLHRRRLARGMCVACGKHPHGESVQTCEDCARAKSQKAKNKRMRARALRYEQLEPREAVTG